MDILLIGLSHKTSSIALRERMAFTPATLRSALTHFDATHSKAHLNDVNEGVILSTCNRLEVYALVQNREVAKEAIIDFLSYSCDIEADEFRDHLYILDNQLAAHHLMRVACGLDSMVLGEPQILGQITEAFEAAQAQGAVRTVLSALFRAAIHTGKRARTETSIGVNPASVSSVAAALAGNVLGDLSEQHVVLIGAGIMGEAAVKALRQRGASEITVVNRTYENAEKLALPWGGKAVTFQQLPEALRKADIIISSTGAPHTILNRDLLEPAMRQRPDRPLFIIDIALPRDIDPNVTELANVHLRDIDSLQEQANDNVRERELEIPQVEAIVAEEVEQFLSWLASLNVVSTITDLRRQIEALRQSELQRLFNRLDLDERERELVATMSHRLVNKILHQPTVCLKREAAKGNAASYSSTVRQLFSLGGTEPAHPTDPTVAELPAKNRKSIYSD
ncbi:MAG: glutamyl-tRNA reductase [Anaerolineae bacterium]|nr:glutamyl-tRNA reductase [Anaerolineae bacterium]